MISYSSEPKGYIKTAYHSIAEFDGTENMDKETVEAFGEEWSKFNSFTDEEIVNIGNEYFDIVPSGSLSKDSTVLDVGCGSGRWTYYVANKVKAAEAIDPSNAVLSASELLHKFNNVRITKASVDSLPFADNSFDLVFSLGVLHHVPDTAKAIKSCVEKVKPGGHFLVYLYYSLDNRGLFYKMLFGLSNVFRIIICKLPHVLKKMVCDIIAFCVYVPLVITGRTLIKMGLKGIASRVPLYYYTDKTLFVIRNDALDRFGTPLEQRFSKNQIISMLESAGLTSIIFSDKAPYWHAIGTKK